MLFPKLSRWLASALSLLIVGQMLNFGRVFDQPLGQLVERYYAGSVLFDFVVFTAQVDLEKMGNVCSLCIIRDLFAELAIV